MTSSRLTRILSQFATLDFAPLRYALWLRFHGIDFAGESASSLGLPESSNMHAHSGGPHLEQVLSSLTIPPGSRAIDIGSGKGLATFTMAKYFDKVIGVEMSRSLMDTAIRNRQRLGLKNVAFDCSDATKYDHWDFFTYVYMFNPFKSDIMNIVAANLRRSVTEDPRQLTIIYKAPYCSESLEANGFKEVRRFKFRESHDFAIFHQ